jgi:nitrate/nitrite-specific signal transduction histidine kinase
MGQLDTSEYVHNSRDEIGSLSASLNRMRCSLQNAMSMLEEQELSESRDRLSPARITY